MDKKRGRPSSRADRQQDNMNNLRLHCKHSKLSSAKVRDVNHREQPVVKAGNREPTPAQSNPSAAEELP